MAANLPIKKFRAGNIEAAIWLNEKEVDGNKIEFKTASLRRSWKKDDQWHDQTINLRKNDIQKVILVLSKIHEEILLAEDKEESD